MQHAHQNAPSNAARVPAATNNNSHNSAAKPAVAPHQFLKEPAEEPVETGPQRHVPQESWTAVQQKRENTAGAHVLQRKCDYSQQNRWAANYVDSGLTVESVFDDDDLKRGDTANNDTRGTVAHEHIQKTNGSWIKEYGIPPAVEGGGWRYADMVKNKEIYEIKPKNGGEDAVKQAGDLVELANKIEPGHKLATAGIIRDTDPLLTKEPAVINPVTRMNENDTYTLHLNYWKERDGEILYEWKIKNTSAEERIRGKEKRKRDEKKDEKKKEENAKFQKGQKFTIAEAFAKKKPTAKKTASTVAESPSATPETTALPETEAPEAEAEEPEEEEVPS